MTSRPPAKASPAVRGADGDHDRRLRERHGADAVLDGGGAQPVAGHRGLRDRPHGVEGHRLVGLVLEAVDLAGHALEGHDRAGPRVAHPRGHRVERERGVAQRDVDRGSAGPAADRRQQRELVAGLRAAGRPARARG